MGTLNLFGFLPVGWLDLIDILLVALLLYKLYGLVRGTTAIRVFTGVLSIYLLWLVVAALQMQLMSEIFRQFINVGVIALIIVFQQEIRKFLVAIGNSSVFRNIGANGGLWTWLGKTEETDRVLDTTAISDAVFALSASKTGALIIIEREANLQHLIDNGKSMNAEVNAALIENLFFKNSPLHDGAMIVRGNKIVACSSTLPLSTNEDLPAAYGMRHKAAIGVSEELDVVAVLVSEETGEIALVAEGNVLQVDDKARFHDLLANAVKGTLHSVAA